MNKREMKKFQTLLEAEAAHLSQGIKSIEESTLEGAEREVTGDLTSFAEAGTDTNERDTALRLAASESTWLREVNEALRRIEEGTYGKCEGCAKEIPKKRLEFYPSARYCVDCQSKIEKTGSL